MSESFPEPSQVGSAAGGNPRASDADRDEAAELLRTAYAEGRITYEEHTERMDAALKAKTFHDLIPITADLSRYRRPGYRAHVYHRRSSPQKGRSSNLTR